jgi:hypothetical protein
MTTHCVDLDEHELTYQICLSGHKIVIIQTNYKAQFSINPILQDKIEKKINYKKRPRKENDSSHLS